jgi:prepilin-type N-terminal cleavage/methylation domain-containing protein
MHITRNTSGFTLVEMVIAVTIFAVMSTAIISTYLQTTIMSQRLKATRYLAESAREITETIALDARTFGITGATISGFSYPYWDGSTGYDYTGSGTEILGIGDGMKTYMYGRKDSAGIDPCEDTAAKNYKTDPKEHCGLYRVEWTDYVGAMNLVDSFIPDEKKKRVKIDDMKFYISGDGVKTEKKVTIVFTLALMPRIGVPIPVDESKLHLETTISGRSYQKN